MFDDLRQVTSSKKAFGTMSNGDTTSPTGSWRPPPVHSPEGQAYLDSMNAAANFAFANRAVLAERLRTVLRLEMGVDGEARTLYDVAQHR